MALGSERTRTRSFKGMANGAFAPRSTGRPASSLTTATLDDGLNLTRLAALAASQLKDATSLAGQPTVRLLRVTLAALRREDH